MSAASGVLRADVLQFAGSRFVKPAEEFRGAVEENEPHSPPCAWLTNDARPNRRRKRIRLRRQYPLVPERSVATPPLVHRARARQTELLRVLGDRSCFGGGGCFCPARPLVCRVCHWCLHSPVTLSQSPQRFRRLAKHPRDCLAQFRSGPGGRRPSPFPRTPYPQRALGIFLWVFLPSFSLGPFDYDHQKNPPQEIG